MLLILVLLAAAAGIIYTIHQQVHRDCSHGCEGCSLANKCKRDMYVMVAMVVALSACGINVEHHCRECGSCHECHCGDDDCCENHNHCDHCPQCYFLHLDFGQYDYAHSPELPAPGELQIFATVPMLPQEEDYIISAELQILVAHAPPTEGRRVLQLISQFLI